MNTSSLPLKSIETLVDSFQGNNAPALSFYQGRTLVGRTTYSELHQSVLSLTHFLVESLGIARGDRVLILSENRLEVPALLLAIFVVGAVAVPLNPTGAPDDWEFISGHSGARGIFATSELRTKFLESGRSLEFALEIEALAPPKKHSTLRNRSHLDPPDEISLVLYTSGTTGQPKGVALNQRALLHSAWSMTENFSLKRSIQLAVLPLYHAHALGFGLMTALTTRGHLVFMDRFDPFAWSEVINREEVTHTSVVPTFLPLLLSTRVHQTKVPTLRCLLVSSAPLSTLLAREFETKTEIRLVQGWGLSEYTNFACCQSPDEPRALHEKHLFGGESTSVGRPLPGTEVIILGDDGQLLGEGITGELCILGPSQMNSYFSDPTATERTMTNGWLRTGDQGHFIGGNFYITGRIKEIIIRNGDKISPVRVENTLLKSLPNFVSRLAVLGFAHRCFGEEVGAYVDMTSLCEDDLDQLREALQSLPVDQRPKVVITGRTPLPRTHTGKVQRRRLLPLFAVFRDFKGPSQILSLPTALVPLTAPVIIL